MCAGIVTSRKKDQTLPSGSTYCTPGRFCHWGTGIRIADEDITTAQCVSQDIVLSMFRGDFTKKNMVPPGITQANTMRMLLIFQATSMFLGRRIFTCSNLQKIDTEEIRPINAKMKKYPLSSTKTPLAGRFQQFRVACSRFRNRVQPFRVASSHTTGGGGPTRRSLQASSSRFQTFRV